jgi:hypothetical protein
VPLGDFTNTVAFMEEQSPNTPNFGALVMTVANLNVCIYLTAKAVCITNLGNLPQNLLLGKAIMMQEHNFGERAI